MGARRRGGTPGVAFLQTFDKLLQASVIACSVVPEAGMPGSHHPNLCAANATHLLINNSRSDNRTVDRRHRSVLLSKPNEKNTNRIDSLIAGVETGPTNGKMPRVGRQKLSAVELNVEPLGLRHGNRLLSDHAHPQPDCLRTSTVNPNKALWEKGDFTRLAQSMRKSGESLVKGLGITKGLKVLSSSKDATLIPATYLRVTVAVS